MPLTAFLIPRHALCLVKVMKCCLLQGNAAHAFRTLSDCIGEMCFFLMKRTGPKDKGVDAAPRDICNEADKAGERNLLGMVGLVPEVTPRNVRVLTGMFSDTSASLHRQRQRQGTAAGVVFPWLPPATPRGTSTVWCVALVCTHQRFPMA